MQKNPVWTDVSEKLPGFVAAGVLDRDGLLVDGLTLDPDFHIEYAAATFITLVHEAEKAGQQTGVGSNQEIQLAYQDTIVILRSLNNGQVLGLAARRHALLGMIRMFMDQLQEKMISFP